MAEQHPFKPILLDLLQQAHLDQDTFVQELNPAERAAIGTPDYWSAKDHVAHMAFWRQRLVIQLAAVLVHETPPEIEPFLQVNEQIFREYRQHSWSEVLQASEQADSDLAAHIAQLAEEDLVEFNRFDWITDHDPLYAVIMGSGYEHARDHFAQYYLDRNDLDRATHLSELWTNRIVQTEAPDALKGIVLFNLACFYATHMQLEKARATLSDALLLAPHLKEWSEIDPDLITLREKAV